MPKVAYSEAEKAQVREALLTKGLELLAKQGIQHTTVEQIYKAVGISRTFFSSFFPTKESLIIEALYPPAAKGSCIRTEIDGCSLFEFRRRRLSHNFFTPAATVKKMGS